MLHVRARHGRDPEELASLDVDECLDDKSRKGEYVRKMFDVLAPGYDAFTRWFSFGMDRKWKARLVSEAVKRAALRPVVADLACGTGDLGTELARRAGARLAVGLDVSRWMLMEARGRQQRDGTGFTVAGCDMLALCLADNCADVVSVGYGLRNVADAAAALQEIARVLRPGGVLATLDFYQPTGKMWRELFLWYLWNAGRLAGWLWHREPITYGYIARSIRRYFTIPEYERQLGSAGFRVEFRAAPLGGGIGIHVARRVEGWGNAQGDSSGVAVRGGIGRGGLEPARPGADQPLVRRAPDRDAAV